jgi:hypothetical protein
MRRGVEQRGKQSEQGVEQCRREGLGFPSLNSTEDKDERHGGSVEKPRWPETVGTGGGLGQNRGRQLGALARRARGHTDQWAPPSLDIF